ncbi:MAG: DUF87 domain-containing protein, partial [Myxococcota bacterium]
MISAVPEPGVEPQVVEIEQAWNDARTAEAGAGPETDGDYVELLSWATVACMAEVPAGGSVSAEREDDMLALGVTFADGHAESVLVGICNKAPQGGGLGNQIKAVRNRAGARIPAVVRCSEYPNSPRARVVKQLGEMLRDGGRRVVVEDTEWRTMSALQAFSRDCGDRPGFAAWRRATQPLGQLTALRELLALDKVRKRSATRGQSAETKTDTESGENAGAITPNPPINADNGDGATIPPVPAPQAPGPAHGLVIGKTAALVPKPVIIKPTSLAKHAAFLGATGSGKTTLALSIIEQLLLRQVSVILLDRKGDLAGYGDRSSWLQPDPSVVETAERAARRARLADTVDVAIYTPGDPSGRPLTLPVVPSNMADMASHERHRVARYAAAALAAMMLYKENAGDRARLGILAKAIELLAQLAEAGEATVNVSLDSLIDLIGSEDPALINAIGRLDTKHFGKLVEHLATLRLNSGELLSS